MKTTCLGCKHFKIVDEEHGFCRVDKGSKNSHPKVKLSDKCEQWRDCGQNYYIRLGWLRANQSRSTEK